MMGTSWSPKTTNSRSAGDSRLLTQAVRLLRDEGTQDYQQKCRDPRLLTQAVQGPKNINSGGAGT